MMAMWDVESLNDLIPVLSLSDLNVVIVSDTPEKNMICLESIKSSIETYFKEGEMKGKVRII